MYLIKSLLTLIIAGILLILLAATGYIKYQQDRYVRGKYGIRCYKEDREHKNIKNLLYFNSIELCENSLKI
jgi:hypothetical protein